MDLFQQMRQSILAKFGEPVTITSGSDSLMLSGVFQVVPGPPSQWQQTQTLEPLLRIDPDDLDLTVIKEGARVIRGNGEIYSIKAIPAYSGRGLLDIGLRRGRE